MWNELLNRAVEIAIKAHEGQLDKQGKAYILHPIAVMESVGDIKTKVVAILHDVIEDTSVTLIGIMPDFPPEIIEAVDAISKRKGETNRDYIARVKANDLATAVKFADLGHNMSLERLFNLDEETVVRLAKKYRKAWRSLNELD